jgi:hypothetical protein
VNGVHPNAGWLNGPGAQGIQTNARAINAPGAQGIQVNGLTRNGATLSNVSLSLPGVEAKNGRLVYAQ